MKKVLYAFSIISCSVFADTVFIESGRQKVDCRCAVGAATPNRCLELDDPKLNNQLDWFIFREFPKSQEYEYAFLAEICYRDSLKADSQGYKLCCVNSVSLGDNDSVVKYFKGWKN